MSRDLHGNDKLNRKIDGILPLIPHKKEHKFKASIISKEFLQLKEALLKGDTKMVKRLLEEKKRNS